MSTFIERADRIVEALLESRPGLASSAGDHRYDDRLPDWSADAVAADREMLREAAHALAEVDADSLPVDESVDHALLSALVDRELFEYVCQQSNYAHELMVGTFERVDRSTTIVP